MGKNRILNVGCLIGLGLFAIGFLLLIGFGVSKNWTAVVLSIPVGALAGVFLYLMAISGEQLWQKKLTYEINPYTGAQKLINVGPWEYVRDLLPEGFGSTVLGGALLGPIVVSIWLVWPRAVPQADLVNLRLQEAQELTLSQTGPQQEVLKFYNERKCLDLYAGKSSYVDRTDLLESWESYSESRQRDRRSILQYRVTWLRDVYLPVMLDKDAACTFPAGAYKKNEDIIKRVASKTINEPITYDEKRALYYVLTAYIIDRTLAYREYYKNSHQAESNFAEAYRSNESIIDLFAQKKWDTEPLLVEMTEDEHALEKAFRQIDMAIKVDLATKIRDASKDGIVGNFEIAYRVGDDPSSTKYGTQIESISENGWHTYSIRMGEGRAFNCIMAACLIDTAISLRNVYRASPSAAFANAYSRYEATLDKLTRANWKWHSKISDADVSALCGLLAAYYSR